MPTIPTPIQHSPVILRAIRQEEETNGMQIGKEIVKIPLIADNMILYLKDTKSSTQNS
jgi:hypothetical protein